MALKKRKRRGTLGKRKPKEVDSVTLRELDLYAENSGELYGQKKAILANVKRKVAKGIYDPTRAPTLWRYWVDAAAKRYQQEFGTPDLQIFDTATKDALAKDLAKRYPKGEE